MLGTGVDEPFATDAGHRLGEIQDFGKIAGSTFLGDVLTSDMETVVPGR